MPKLMQSTAVIIISLLVFAEADGMNSCPPQKQTGKQELSTSSQDETQILEVARELLKDNKIEEALGVLDKGMEQFPASTELLNEALQIYEAEGRHEESIRLLNDRAKNFPEKTQRQIRSAKQAILQPLIESLLKEGRTDKALNYLLELADAGYRGFHQLKHNALYEPLRQRAEFKDVLKKISENTGLDRPPRDFAVTLTGGGTYTLSARKGKVVLVDFWSTSCPPCIKELPNIGAIYHANKKRGFEVISISLDDNKAKLDSFQAANPVPWSTVFSGKGWKDDAAKLYEISSIPSLWLVDREGILRYFDVRGEDLKAAVEKLLAE